MRSFVFSYRSERRGFLDAGDIDGSAEWKRVLRAIKEIQRKERREGEPVN